LLWVLLKRLPLVCTKNAYPNFFAKCDNKPKTLTIIKSSNGCIFGGYTDQCWENTRQRKYDENAFVFSLINLYKKPTKIKIIQNFDRAIYCEPTYGPIFGCVNDELVISHGTNNLKRGKSDLNHCFQLASYPQGSNGSNFLAGSTQFEVTDVEVFMKN
jgi:hypothetical protein